MDAGRLCCVGGSPRTRTRFRIVVPEDFDVLPSRGARESATLDAIKGKITVPVTGEPNSHGHHRLAASRCERPALAPNRHFQRRWGDQTNLAGRRPGLPRALSPNSCAIRRHQLREHEHPSHQPTCVSDVRCTSFVLVFARCSPVFRPRRLHDPLPSFPRALRRLLEQEILELEKGADAQPKPPRLVITLLQPSVLAQRLQCRFFLHFAHFAHALRLRLRGGPVSLRRTRACRCARDHSWVALSAAMTSTPCSAL